MRYFIENVFIKFVDIQNLNKASPMKLLFSVLGFFRREQKQISERNAANIPRICSISKKFHQMSFYQPLGYEGKSLKNERGDSFLQNSYNYPI